MDPEHEDAVFGLGLAYLKRGWNRKARACFARALELNPNKVEFQEAAGEEAEEVFDEAVDVLDPDSAETMERATSLFREGKLKQALPHYRRLLKKFPDNYVLLSTTAVVYFALRRFDESIKVCMKIMELETPEMVRCVAYTISMECLRGQGRFDESIELMNDMREEFPDGYGRTVACCGLALAKADMGTDLREAEALAREALEHTPPDYRHNVLDALGWVFFKQGRYEDSLDLLKSAISMRETLNHLYHYGMVLLALNLQEEAFKIYETIVKLRGKNVTIEDFIYSAIDSELQSAEREES